MNLLLDTHALLWWLSDNPKLGSKARRAIADAAMVGVSMASIWKISIKACLGKLDADVAEIIAECHRNGFELMAIEPAHCIAAATLPRHHGEPFDRMLVIQAKASGLTLLSGDRWADAYGVVRMACR